VRPRGRFGLRSARGCVEPPSMPSRSFSAPDQGVLIMADHPADPVPESPLFPCSGAARSPRSPVGTPDGWRSVPG
jgi:hypothetical protein